MLSPSVLIVGFIALLVSAYLYDEWKWRVRPREKLIEMVRAPDWRLHPKAMAELRRRGEDLAVFIPRFLPLLAAASRTDRVAAESIIRKYFPQVALVLKGYSPLADVEACRERIAPLADRFPSQADT
jgi:hypothetical protein